MDYYANQLDTYCGLIVAPIAVAHAIVASSLIVSKGVFIILIVAVLSLDYWLCVYGYLAHLLLE